MNDVTLIFPPLEGSPLRTEIESRGAKNFYRRLMTPTVPSVGDRMQVDDVRLVVQYRNAHVEKSGIRWTLIATHDLEHPVNPDEKTGLIQLKRLLAQGWALLPLDWYTSEPPKTDGGEGS